MQGEEQQLMDQQMIDQQVQWINDSVQRDILLGDWKTKRASTNNRYPIIVFLVVFLVAAFLMIAAYSITVKAAPPSPEVPSVELYRQEMAKMLGDNPYDSVMSPESREQFEKLHSQADEIQNKAEQDDTHWLYIFLICAIPPLAFVGYVVRAYSKDAAYKPTWKEVLVVSIVTVLTAVVLYFHNVLFFWLRFYANDKVKALAILLTVIIGAVMLWRYSKNKSNQNQ